jgi:hypothetical protein
MASSAVAAGAASSVGGSSGRMGSNRTLRERAAVRVERDRVGFRRARVTVHAVKGSTVGPLLISVALVAAGCSSTDGESSSSSSVPPAPTASAPDVSISTPAPDPTPSPTTTPGTAATASESALLVQRFDTDRGGVSYVLVGPDGSDLATLTAPEGLGEELTVSGITQAAGAATAMVETPAGLATFDAATLELASFLPGAGVEWRDPDGRFLVVTVDGLLEVVDGLTLSRHPLGVDGSLGSVGVAGDRVALTVIGEDDFGAVLVDAATGAVTSRSDGDRTSSLPFDDAGEQLVVSRTGDRGGPRITQIAVSLSASPDAQAVWYESELGPTAAWADDTLVVAEVTGGRVLLVSEGEAVEIGTLPGDGGPALFGDPEAPGVLVVHRGEDTTSWYHVDPQVGSLTPLPELDGMDLSATVTSDAGLLVLDDAVDGSDRSVGRAVAVQPGDGAITELFTATDREVLVGAALSPILVALIGSDDLPLQLFDVASGDMIAIDDGAFARLSPDPTMAAVAIGPGRTRSAALVDLTSGAVEPLTDGQPVGWLQR